MAIAGKVGAVYVQTDAAAVAFTAEATTEDATHLRYTITDGTKCYFDPDTTIIVYGDAVEITSGYTVEYAGGVIVFAVDPAAVITVTGAYLTVEEAGGFFNWSLDVAIDNADISALGDSWKSILPTVNGFSGTAEMFWGDERFFLLMGTKVVFVLYVDDVSTMARYEGFGLIQGDGIEVVVDDVVKEPIDFQGTGALYYRAG